MSNKTSSENSGLPDSYNSRAELECILDRIPSGTITGEQKLAVLRAMENAWDSFIGSDDESTWSSKIYRAESLQWQPPLLEFILERHGATVNGSTRADKHYWRVNVETGEANIYKRGKRQLEPISRPLKVEPIAEKVADAIINHREEPWLTWKDSSRVQVKISLLIPDTNPQTTSARRKRFRSALAELLKIAGWTELKPNSYQWNEVTRPNQVDVSKLRPDD